MPLLTEPTSHNSAFEGASDRQACSSNGTPLRAPIDPRKTKRSGRDVSGRGPGRNASEIYAERNHCNLFSRNALLDQRPADKGTRHHNPVRLAVFRLLGAQQFGEAGRKLIYPFGELATKRLQNPFKVQRVSDASIEDEFAPKRPRPLR